MHYRYATALLTLSACVAPVIDVYPLNPTPRCIMARAVDSVQVLPQMPPDSVAVYGLNASNGNPAELHAALQSKAAHLGCDGVVITAKEAPRQSRGESATGQLNDHREMVPGQLSALCIVLAANK
jgi:hypothetical protein